MNDGAFFIVNDRPAVRFEREYARPVDSARRVATVSFSSLSRRTFLDSAGEIAKSTSH
jgi:hypothetical protein